MRDWTWRALVLLVAEAVDERLGVRDLALLVLGRGLELGASARRAARRSRRSRRRTRWRVPSWSSTTRLTTSLMKSRSWLTSTIAPAYCGQEARSATRPTPGRGGCVGSSSSSTSGFWSSSRASATRIIQPPRELADVALHVAVGEARARPGCAAPRPPARSRRAPRTDAGAGRTRPSARRARRRRSASSSSVSMWRIRRSIPLTSPAPASDLGERAPAAASRRPPGAGSR